VSNRFDDFPGNGHESWESIPESSVTVCRDETTGLRRYLAGDRRYDEVVPGLFVGPDHWDYFSLQMMPRQSWT